MSYSHSNVYIVRIVDTNDAGDINTWFVGPYGSTRAAQIADELRTAAAEADFDRTQTRECYTEPLFSDEHCLRVTDYGRDEHGSLQ